MGQKRKKKKKKKALVFYLLLRCYPGCSSWTEKCTEGVQSSRYTAKCSARLVLIGGTVAKTDGTKTHTQHTCAADACMCARALPCVCGPSLSFLQRQPHH